jgi:hypothetical protein
MKDLHKILQGFLLGQLLLELQVGLQIALVAKLQDQVDVVRCFLYVDQPDHVVVLATLQYLDLVLQQLRKLA